MRAIAFLVLPSVATKLWEQKDYDWTEEEFKKLLGARRNPTGVKYPLREPPSDPMPLPEDYDVLDAYPNCSHFVNDQSVCGSCWAVSTAESITDRLCIAGHGDVRISALDILSCCDKCGNGCDGGWPAAAWDYMVEGGIVDGGVYGDKEHCTAYPFAPCAHHTLAPPLKPCGESQPTPECPRHCNNGEIWGAAKIINTQHVYAIQGELLMMTELVERGPFTVAFHVYSDFMKYHRGIYEKTHGAHFMGNHAVELTGYGVDDQEKYWKIKNSWNPSWGEQGYFRIMRGRDECGIESEGYGADVSQAVIPQRNEKLILA